MRVLQINSVCGYGSTGNIVVDLYHELKKQGHECCIAYGRGKAPGDVHTYRIGSDLDVYVHGMLSRITDRQAFFSKRATKKFVEWMKQYNPDVIHLHNLHGYYINIKILFYVLKELDKPVIWTLHDCWAFTGHCAHFDYIGCEKWKTECNSCQQKREYPISLLIDNSLKNYMEKKNVICSLNNLTIVTPSNWLKKLVKSSFLKKYDTVVIHNGIDTNIFHPTYLNVKNEYGIQDKKVVLGVASEWGTKKGVQDFVHLSDMLDSNWQIVLIGHIAGKIPCKPNITHIERTDNREQLAAWYTEADVFLNLTYEDTYPTVNLEAQACGTPVITYDTGGSPEGVLVGKGSIVHRGDILKIVNSIQSLEENIADVNIREISKESMLISYNKLYERKRQ